MSDVFNDLKKDQQIALVTIDPKIISFFKNQDQTAVSIAVLYDPKVLQFVHNQTDEIVFDALSIDPSVISFVNRPTVDMLKFAIEKNPKLAETLSGLNTELQIEAFWLDKTINVKDPTDEYLEYVKRNTKSSYCVIS